MVRDISDFLVVLGASAATCGAVCFLLSVVEWRRGMMRDISECLALLGASVATCVAFYFMLNIVGKHRERALIRNRNGHTRKIFVTELEERGVPPHISQGVYDHLLMTCTCTGVLPILPSDDLCRVFGLCHAEDLVDAVMAAAKLAGCRAPSEEEIARPQPRMRSVADMALFLAQIDRADPPHG